MFEIIDGVKITIYDGCSEEPWLKISFNGEILLHINLLLYNYEDVVDELEGLCISDESFEGFKSFIQEEFYGGNYTY